MKWVKVAIGAVIAIMSIGIIATSVYGMTQEKLIEEVVTFEVLTYDVGEFGESGTITSGTYQSILNYSLIDGTNILNLKQITLNDTEADTFDIGYYNPAFDISTVFGVDNIGFEFNNDDSFNMNGGSLTVGDTFEFTFEVTQPPQLTGITATLILLTPLIFAGGVLAYLLNKQNY